MRVHMCWFASHGMISHPSIETAASGHRKASRGLWRESSTAVIMRLAKDGCRSGFPIPESAGLRRLPSGWRLVSARYCSPRLPRKPLTGLLASLPESAFVGTRMGAFPPAAGKKPTMATAQFSSLCFHLQISPASRRTPSRDRCPHSIRSPFSDIKMSLYAVDALAFGAYVDGVVVLWAVCGTGAKREAGLMPALPPQL